MNFVRLLKNASFALVASAVIASQATAGTVSVTGSPTTPIGTSADAVMLLSGSPILALTDIPTVFDLQAANFIIGYSNSQTIAFVLNENVTINGVTQSVAFNFTDYITSAADTLVLAPGQIMHFGNATFQLMGTSILADSLGNHLFTVQASMSEVPEPASLAMLGLGLFALGVARRKTAV